LSYKIIYSPDFFESLDKLPIDLRRLFIKKIEKVKREYICRKHLEFGMPYFVEKVNKSARLIYKINDDTLLFIMCFKDHKQYERWYKS